MSFYTFVSPLASSMMAPGLPEIATKYGITNPTVVALTLSIFLLAYALGVGIILSFILASTEPFELAPYSRSSLRNVWTNLGEHRSDPLPFFISYYPPDSPYRQYLDNGSQFGVCIRANNRRPDRLPFSLYVNIPRLFSPKILTHGCSWFIGRCTDSDWRWVGG